jgi:hypothetical protein
MAPIEAPRAQSNLKAGHVLRVRLAAQTDRAGGGRQFRTVHIAAEICHWL